MNTPEEYAWRVFDNTPEGQAPSQGAIADQIRSAMLDTRKDERAHIRSGLSYLNLLTPAIEEALS